MTELETILDLSLGFCVGGVGACINPIFGPTVTFFYWSGDTDAGSSFGAWCVNFTKGGPVGSGNKNGNIHVRAVRTGT